MLQGGPVRGLSGGVSTGGKAANRLQPALLRDDKEKRNVGERRQHFRQVPLSGSIEGTVLEGRGCQGGCWQLPGSHFQLRRAVARVPRPKHEP